MAGSKLYKVVNIDFWNLMIEAVERDLNIFGVPEEVCCIEQFRDFRIKLVNGSDMGEIIDFEEWKGRHEGHDYDE